MLAILSKQVNFAFLHFLKKKEGVRINGKECLNGVGSDEFLKCHNILAFFEISSYDGVNLFYF